MHENHAIHEIHDTNHLGYFVNFAPFVNFVVYELTEERVEVSHVRKRLMVAIERARKTGQERRERAIAVERAYETFLADVATPVTRMLASALKADGYPFTVATPGGSVRLASDRGRDDYIEFALDAASDPPEVIGRIGYGRGSRTITEERPVKSGASPQAITDDDVLEFLLKALEPWLER
jgi:hypothetical protein